MGELKRRFGVLRSRAVCVRDRGAGAVLRAADRQAATVAVGADEVLVRYYGTGTPDDAQRTGRRCARRCGSSDGTACDGLAEMVRSVPRHRVRVVGLPPREAARMGKRAVRAHKAVRARRAASRRRLAGGGGGADAGAEGAAGAGAGAVSLLDEQQQQALEAEELDRKRQRLLKGLRAEGDGSSSPSLSEEEEEGADNEADECDEQKQGRGGGAAGALGRRLVRGAVEPFTKTGRERRHRIAKGAELAVRVTAQRFCRMPKCRGPRSGEGCDLKATYVAVTCVCLQCPRGRGVAARRAAAAGARGGGAGP